MENKRVNIFSGAVWEDLVRPAASMVEVNRLMDPDLLIEIEVTAVVK